VEFKKQNKEKGQQQKSIVSTADKFFSPDSTGL